MTAADVLRSARAKIEDPARWTQGAFARDVRGTGVFAATPEAVCWCAQGAICVVATRCPGAEWDAFDALSRAIGTVLIGPFNDRHSHAEVLAKFDEAIALAEQERAS